MARLTLSLCAAIAFAGPAFAAQPIYKSMVECGAIYTASAELVRSKPKKDLLITAAQVWRAEAVSAVAAARMPDAQSYVAMMHGEKLRLWRGKGSYAALTQEFRDWTAYCRSLADARGITLTSN